LAVLPRYNFEVHPLTTLLFLLYISILYSYRSANSSRCSEIKTEAFYLFISSRFVFVLSKPFNFYPFGKEKKASFFSQSQPTRDIQSIPIYSESPLSKDSESAIRTQKSQIFVEIPKKTSFDLL
jgi:hypothetical protein